MAFCPKAFVFERSIERLPYGVLFAGILLTAFGSSWYHLAPSNDSLMWDRLPMSIIFAAFISITIMERIGVKAGLVEKALVLYYVMRDEATPLWAKAGRMAAASTSVSGRRRGNRIEHSSGKADRDWTTGRGTGSP